MPSKLLWQPTDTVKQQSNLTRYFNWLRDNPRYALHFSDYQQAWEWSVNEPGRFWESLVAFFQVKFHTPYHSVMEGEMPVTDWFRGATVNYAEHVFSQYSDDHPAILYCNETSPVQTLTWNDLRQQVSALAAWLQSNGVGMGDRVVGYLPNIPEATVAFLATASLGAIWSSASPDFGAASVLERFGQIEPRVLIAVNGYSYGGKSFDKMEVVRELQDNIHSLNATLLFEYEGPGKSSDLEKTTDWNVVINQLGPELTFMPVPFSHPLWVLYSSGTTGIPKAIVHSQGGMLLEHLKYGAFHNDVHPGERFLWFTTTGWMMWNYLNAMLLGGATIVLYDGSPGYPDMGRLWKLVSEYQVHHFGVSAAFILATMKSGYSPQNLDLSALRSIGSTGSPLPPEGFDWIYTHVKPDIWLTSISGGTDVCTAFVGGNPLLPVYEGEIQCRAAVFSTSFQ